MIENKVIEYIAETQPVIEKYASQKTVIEKYANQEQSFKMELVKKLDSLKKMGSISDKQYSTIYKESMENPASIFKHLDIPAYTHSIGTVEKARPDYKVDSLVEFCNS